MMKDEAEALIGCSFVYTDEDSGALLRLYMRVNPVMRRAQRSATWRWFRFLGVLWVVAFLALAALIWRGGGGGPGWLFRITLAATFIMFLAAFAGGLEAAPRRRRMSLKALGRGMPPRRGSFSVEVAEGWIRLWSEDSDESIRLGAIDEVVAESGHIFLVIDHVPRMQIPERGFDSPAELEAFMGRLQEEAAMGRAPDGAEAW